jgi:hypothetical protein
LKRRFPVAQAYQLAATGKKDFMSTEGIRVCPAVDHLAQLVQPIAIHAPRLYAAAYLRRNIQ